MLARHSAWRISRASGAIKPFIPVRREPRGMPREQKQVRELQEGSYVMMEDSPCKINAYSTAKPGKHGSAKARIEGKGVFDDKKRSLSQPVDAKVWVPIIQRKQGQVVSVSGNDAQVMDLDTYETFTMRVPEDEDFTPDQNIEYLEYEGQRKVVG
ncbi:translation initiation factor IF-5A [Halobacterium noricense]